MLYALILAGGTGSRMGSSTPKQFLKISGIPIIAWSMMTFQRMREIEGIITACPRDNVTEIKKIAEEYNITKLTDIVAGGSTRQMSSYNALRARTFSDDDIVLIHDAARPFVSTTIITRCAETAEKTGAACTYVPVKDTIAEVEHNIVRRTLNREMLRSAQTPQAFRYPLIIEAHEHAIRTGIQSATDDVTLVLMRGKPVYAVEGDYRNIKITTQEDLPFAEHIARMIRGNTHELL